MRYILTVLALLMMIALAQDSSEGSETETATTEATAAEKRIISIDSSGGNQSGNLRFGPIAYEHPDPEGIEATVSNLRIFAQKAELRGPEGEEVSLTDAKGRRLASFTEGVRVTRNRLEAKGPELSYSEELGLGTLTGSANIRVEPKEEGDDPVLIQADVVEFDVDTDESVSRGNVVLDNGNQSAEADELIFEEERNLSKLTREGAQVTARRIDDNGDELTITADEIRALSDNDKLLARGNVTIIDGSITSTGDLVFFDDAASRAEIIGINQAASSIDSDEGIEITGDRIEQRTDLDTISLIDASIPSEFSEDDFVLRRETQP